MSTHRRKRTYSRKRVEQRPRPQPKYDDYDDNYDDEPVDRPVTSIDTKSVTGIGGIVILMINFKEIIVQLIQKFLLGG
tara:strand:+ start:205 stop:438 length:234 start_codon:yes stop_codon:yes gene_type:complete